VEPVIQQKTTHDSWSLESLLTELVEPMVQLVTTKKQQEKAKEKSKLN
jgi:hypothetical protein